MRFRKSIKIMPGVRVNLSKSGVSTSIGGRGTTLNVNKRGVRSTLSVPGTGLSWASTSGWSESQRSRPADEIENLRKAAVKSISVVSKEADKLNAIGTRVDRAINTLNGGKGLTRTKVQTFEKRVLAEEQKIGDLEEKVREHRLFLDAIVSRLVAMQFGMFAGRDRKHRDRVAEALASYAREASGIEEQISAAHFALSSKLSEAQDRLDDTENDA